MEALQSAFCNLETQRASGVIQLESVGLSIRGADGISPSLRDGEDKMSQLNSEAVGGSGGVGGGEREEAHSFILHLLFYSGLNRLVNPHPQRGRQ